MKRVDTIVMPCLVMLLFLASVAAAAEDCSKLGGKCRDGCGPGEQAESGAFEDCGAEQECCVAHDPARDAVRCCISSFDARQFGPKNCGVPVNGLCLKGSGSPAPCEKLIMCR